jgi:copper chaperone
MILMETMTINVQGMTCGHCQKVVTEALKGVPGVADAVVDLAAKTATVTYDPARTGFDQFKAVVEEEGYEVVGRG